jgi:hypothetical protein
VDADKDTTDLTKAVLTDDTGEWFIVPEEYVDAFFTTNHVSAIVHQCHKWNTDLRSSIGLPYQPLGYWMSPGSVDVPCKLCDVRPPDKIASLWLLHNFDTFAGDPSGMSRIISKDVLMAGLHFDHTFCIVDGPCPCGACVTRYGGEE